MSLKRNVLANYIGQGWRAIMSLAFIPLYIRYLGIEAYGLIGIFVMLQAWLALLDMGMKPALAREMARFTGGRHDAQTVWDLLRSIEIIALGVAVAIAFGVWAASTWLANTWVQPDTIPTSEVADAFSLMGLVISVRFIENIYTNSIAGLQRQVVQNLVTSIMATVRGIGAVAVLIWISPSIKAFFIWQGLISLLTVGIFMAVVYRILPSPSQAPRLSASALLDVWRFAAGMLGITLLALLLTQIDKIVLARALTLDSFGYYALAAAIAGGLYTMITPIGAAFYPRLTELFARQDSRALIRTYHLGAQLVAVVMGSATVVLIIFADRILLLWTADAVLTKQVSPIMVVLAFGTFLHGLMWMPYQLQLAHGWTTLSIRINVVAVLFYLPALLFIVPVYGAIGAAWVWVALNAGYILVGVHFMYQRILRKEKKIWYSVDTFVPILAATTSASVFHWAMPENLGALGELFILSISFICVFVLTAAAAPLVRKHLIELAKNRFSPILRKTA